MNIDDVRKEVDRATAYLAELEKGLAALPLDCKMKMPEECHAAIYQAVGAMGAVLKIVTRGLAGDHTVRT